MNHKFNAKLGLIISSAIVVVALLMTVFGYGFNQGTDFTGGTLLRLEMGQAFDAKDVQAAISAQGISQVRVVKVGTAQTEAQATIKQNTVTDDLGVKVQAALSGQYPQAAFIGAEAVSPVAGSQLAVNAVLSLLVGWVLMLAYVAIRFGLAAGLSAVAGNLHDVLVTLGLAVILRVPVNVPFVAGVLAVVGLSVCNTLLILSNVRESVKNPAGRGQVHDRAGLVADAVKGSMGRTVTTLVIALVAAVALYLLGVPSVKELALVVGLGAVVSACSATQISGHTWVALGQNAKAVHPKKA